MTERIGSGAFGVVYKAVDLSRPGKRFAIKVICKSKLQGTDKIKISNEYTVLQDLHHPNIVHLCEVIDDANDDRIYIVFIYLTRYSI
jgi:serine/threonine protein kinase